MSQSRPAIADRDIAGCVMKSGGEKPTTSITFDSEPTSIRFVADGDRHNTGSIDSGTAISSTAIGPVRRLLAVLAAVLLLAGMSAAAPTQAKEQDNEDWPYLETVAQEYADCMTHGGLLAQVIANDQGQLTRVIFLVTHALVWRDAMGSGGIYSYSSSDNPTDQAAYDELIAEAFNNANPHPIFVMDGVDHTAVFLGCLASTGYDEGRANGLESTASQAQIAQRTTGAMLMADERWADCAQRAGWESVENATWSVDIPIDITESQLKTLLEACPTPGVIGAGAWLELAMRYPGDYYSGSLVNPDILFRISLLEAAYPPGWMPDAQRQAIIDRAIRLTDILNQARDPEYPQFYPQYGR